MSKGKITGELKFFPCDDAECKLCGEWTKTFYELHGKIHCRVHIDVPYYGKYNDTLIANHCSLCKHFNKPDMSIK